MKSKLVNVVRLSGPKATIYSIVTEDSKVTFLDRFIDEYKGQFIQDVVSIVTRLKSMGNVVGALTPYFKLDEGLVWNDLVCAVYDIPDKHLRLYCIRLSEQILVVGGGGPKAVRAWQDDPKLSKEVGEMMHYSEIIRTRLKRGSLQISENGLKIEGNLMLTR